MDSRPAPASLVCHLSAAKRAPARARRCLTKTPRSGFRRCSLQEFHGQNGIPQHDGTATKVASLAHENRYAGEAGLWHFRAGYFPAR